MPDHEHIDRGKSQVKVHGAPLAPAETVAPAVQPREGFSAEVQRDATSQINLSTAMFTKQPQGFSGSIARTSIGNRGTELDSTITRRLWNEVLCVHC